MNELLVFFSGPFSLTARKNSDTLEIDITQREGQHHRDDKSVKATTNARRKYPGNQRKEETER